jgi:DNA-directed RNA polymerase alpha subunit
MAEELQCKACRFWLRQAPEDLSGQCRRFPPCLAQTEKQQAELEATGAGSFTGVWPDTLGVDWCGEFQARPATPADTPLSALQLSTRTLTCLAKANVATVGDLASRTAADLKAIRNFGDASLREVQQKLADRGLALREVLA